MRTTLILCLLLPAQEPRKPAAAASIDAAVRGIPGYDLKRQAPLSDDGEFLRRAMLDLTGSPPDAEQTRAFVADAAPGKRAAKIDELLNSPEWADYWSRLFGEVFFGNYHDVPMETQPKVSKAASARMVDTFLKWFGGKLRKDAPWTDIVDQILDARGTDEGDPALAWKLSLYREDGFYSEFAQSTARQFLGIRLICAKCHNHPFDAWDVPHYYGLAAFVARQKVRGVGGSAEKDATDHVELKYADEGEVDIPAVEVDSEIVHAGKPGRAKPIFLFGGEAPPGPGDRVKLLSSLITQKSTTQLPRALANRVWGWLFERGIVHPVDDFAIKRKSSLSPGLLDVLTRHLIDSKYSLKTLIRTICATDAYQRSCHAEGASKPDFSRAAVKPLNGEQLLNAIHVATSGAPKRDAGQVLRMVASLFPAGAVWCETTPLPGNARQALLLRNNPEIMGWIASGGVLAKIKAGPGSVEEKVDAMFLAALSRTALPAERARYAAFLNTHAASGWEDAYWTLLNSTEFVTRH
ncbi:MAG TPA: DUF1549 domain-containing protein [Planctomycetota bacterium]